MRPSTLLLTLTSTTLTTSSLLRPRQQQLCNGRADFCNRIYSNVSWIGTHNAPFIGTADPPDPRVNQEKTVPEQLDAGIRFLQGQTQILINGAEDAGPLSELYMCHTDCAIYNGGSLRSYLTTVKNWVDAHPDEVVTMLLTNGDNVDVSEFGDAFNDTGMDALAFVPATSPAMLQIGDWPTYGELIASGKRVVVFLDYGANETKVPYVLDEFTYYFETPFSQTDPTFSQCRLDRPPNGSPDGRMYLVNHVLDKQVPLTDILIPDHEADFTTNAATGNGSIGAQVELCEGIYGRVPNVVLVDMFDRGDVFTAQDALNGV
ncbi:hypothetical protein PRZ48_001465 [Zasmidium cellare]|uniref:PLC-like phosphodiesterase n=1 Tax=Zasmidium cellare TaxID=395010 RepID=A0ABR0F2U8_ZASCE|nr:hypothetical protein PRZ48_001465 [Zasmidium cellare]